MEKPTNYIKLNGEYYTLSPKNNDEHRTLVSILIQLMAAIGLNSMGDVEKMPRTEVTERIMNVSGEMGAAIAKAALVAYARRMKGGKPDA